MSTVHHGVYLLVDVPAGLHRAAKMRAAAECLTLKGWVLKTLAAAVRPPERDDPEGGETGVVEQVQA